MYRFRRENVGQLQTHNIRITELNHMQPVMSTPPRKVIHIPKVRMLARGSGRPSIRITNVKSIKPPDPETVKRQEEDKLRAQLQKEIVSRSRSCSYKRFKCTLPVVSGRSYCARHITQDPSAPYGRCSHDRCDLPAPKGDHQACFEHARAAMLARQRAAAPPAPLASTETLLTQLQHYVKAERTRTTSSASTVSVVSEPAEQEIVPHAVDPFKQIDAPAVNAAYSSAIMECASASDSDADSVVISGAEAGDDNSDPEDAPCEDGPLWRAGVYTAEEAVSEAKSTLKELQAAYTGQMSRLKVLLQTARLNYLRTLKQEREQYCSIWSWCSQGALTAHERRQLQKLKAYAGYRRKHGVHAVLARKLMRKRAKVNETQTNRPIPSQGRCTFAEGGVRCGNHVLPASKHCLKHILHDRHQVLFVMCGDVRGGVPCREGRARLPPPAAACRYHTDPPTHMFFTLKKDDESDSTSVSGVSTESEGLPLLPLAPPATPRA